MVTRLFSATARHTGAAAGGPRSLLALLSVMTWGALAIPACEKVPLTAPTGTVITLVASTNVLPLNGSTDLTAVLIENGTGESTGASGTPVHNGTLVTFTTSLGRIEPAEARTSNGRVTVKLISDGRSGIATVKAFSGGATSEDLEITVGAAATAAVTTWATPASLPANGGSALISARVADGSGNPLPGIPVNFTTTAGTVTPSTAVTGQDGVATAALSTTREAVVRAIAGGQTGTATVTLRSKSGIDITVPASAAYVGAPVSFTVKPDTTVAFASVTIDFGDGQSRSLGPISKSTTVVHYYESSGVFDASVLGNDVDGGVAEASGSVAVIPWQFTLTSSSVSGTTASILTFTVSGIPTPVPINRILWNFGDGTTLDTNSTSAQHSFSTEGNKTITATVFPLYGDARSTSVVVRITSTLPN